MSPIFAILASLAFFQEEPLIQEKYTVQYVMLDVVAVDKRSGKMIKDLKLSDFVVTENRKKVKVQTFEVLDFSSPVEAPAAPAVITAPTSSGPPPGLTIAEPPPLEQYILAIDLESAMITEIHRAFSEVEKFVKQLETRENLGIMVYSLSHGALTDGFVEDPKALFGQLLNHRDQFIGEIKPNQGSSTVIHGDNKQHGGRTRLNRSLEELERKFDQCRNLYNPRDQGGIARLNGCIDDELAAFIDIQEIRVERAIGELEALTFRFTETPGPKTILFLSPGFSLQPGTAGIELARLYRSGSVDPNQGSRDPTLDLIRAQQPNFNSTSVSARSYEREFRRVAHACIRNRVVFHTFDAFNFGMAEQRQLTSGKRMNRAVTEAYKTYVNELNGGLYQLARESGGRFFASTTVVGPMLNLTREPQYIYVLGYQSPLGKKGYRKIKIKCKRRGVELRHRAGYFGG